VALGFHLDDKIPTTVYQRRRDGSGDQGWGFDSHAEPVTFQTERISSHPDEPSRVGLAVSLTAPIGCDVVAAASNASVYEITPLATAPSRDVMTARASLDAFAATYHRFLGIVERDHPDCAQIEIFPAAPASAAVELGRGIMRDAQPDLVIYDRQIDGTFQPALTLTR
jgi:SMODS-associated and fused to various effectors sensor domain